MEVYSHYLGDNAIKQVMLNASPALKNRAILFVIKRLGCWLTRLLPIITFSLNHLSVFFIFPCLFNFIAKALIVFAKIA